MHYFHTFGFIEETWNMALGFLVVSIAAALVESHPISTELDDNLTIPLTSFLVGSLIFWCLASKGSWDVFLYHVLTCKRLRTVVNCENCTLSMVNIFSVVSVAATLVELHPIRTEMDYNLTVPSTSFLVGIFIFIMFTLKGELSCFSASCSNM